MGSGWIRAVSEGEASRICSGLNVDYERQESRMNLRLGANLVSSANSPMHSLSFPESFIRKMTTRAQYCFLGTFISELKSAPTKYRLDSIY